MSVNYRSDNDVIERKILYNNKFSIKSCSSESKLVRVGGEKFMIFNCILYDHHESKY